MTNAAMFCVLFSVIFLGTPSRASAQSKSACRQNTPTKSLLIKATQKQIRAVMDNYAEAVENFINRNDAICRKKDELSNIASNIGDVIERTLPSGGIPVKLIAKSVKYIPWSYCKANFLYQRNTYIRPESEYMDDVVKALKQMPYEDVMADCEGMDPDNLDVDFFKKELEHLWHMRH